MLIIDFFDFDMENGKLTFSMGVPPGNRFSISGFFVVSEIIAFLPSWPGGVRYLFGITPPMMTFVCPVRKGWLANVVPSFDVKKTFGLNVWDDSSIEILPP